MLEDLNAGDHVAVWVNDNRKVNKNDRNRSDHFIGILMRPDTLCFKKKSKK